MHLSRGQDLPPGSFQPLQGDYDCSDRLEQLEQEQDDVIERINHFQRRARELKRLIRDARQIRAARRATFVGPATGHGDTTAGRA